MKVLQAMGCYHCGECGGALHFGGRSRPDNFRLTEGNNSAVGYCRGWNCSRKGVLLKVIVQAVDCEVVGKEED